MYRVIYFVMQLLQWRHYAIGADRPGWHHPGGWYPNESKKFFAAKFYKGSGETITWKMGRGWEWWQWL